MNLHKWIDETPVGLPIFIFIFGNVLLVLIAIGVVCIKNKMCSRDKIPSGHPAYYTNASQYTYISPYTSQHMQI